VTTYVRNLFLKDSARLSRGGLYYKGIHFACDTKLAEQWVVRSKRSERIDIVYDPSDTSSIWLVDPSNGSLHEAPLAEIDKRFLYQPWQEVEELFARDARARAIEQSAAEERTIAYDVEVETIVKSAVKAQQEAFKLKGAVSKSERTHMIRPNRREEANRTKQQAVAPKPLASAVPEIPEEPTVQARQYVGASTSLEKFKKRREVSNQ
jgi:putative transposase